MVTYRDVLRQPLGDVQIGDLDGDFFAVAWLGHADGSQILPTQEERKYMRESVSTLPAHTAADRSQLPN